jgi:hypothetical protein
MPTKNKNLYVSLFFLFLIIFFFTSINKVFAATASFSPSSGTYNVGDTIKVKVLASSNKSINAFSTNVSFSKDTLSLTSISKSPSLIDLWPRDPVYSNSDGFANFEGVILNGYTGNAGNIITLIFKAKAVGTASIRFTNVSILANDGNGTDIFLGGLATATFNIEKAVATPNVVKKEPTPTPTCINTNTGVPEPTISCIAINAIDKIKEVEVANNLPNNSLLITVAIVFIIILSLITIYLFYLIYRLRKYFKSKLSKTEDVIYKNFENLEKDIESKEIDQKKSKGIKSGKGKEDDILKEVEETEEKIIKEVEKIEDEV